MKFLLKFTLTIAAMLLAAGLAIAQNFKLGEVLFLSTSPMEQGADAGAFAAYIDKQAESWNKAFPQTTLKVMNADRGGKNGHSMLVCTAAQIKDRKALPPGSPFAAAQLTSGYQTLGSFLENPASYSEYQLLAPEKIKSMPKLGILGIHYIKVKPAMAKDFEKLVKDKLHTAVGHVMPEMQLLYYKAVAGEHPGTYITVFAITSYDARESMWPTGGAEQDIVKTTFGPLKDLGKELATYFEEDSYLGPESGGGAAYWESREWTDYLPVGM